MRKMWTKEKVALQKAAKDAAYKAAFALEQRTLELSFNGYGGIQNQVNDSNYLSYSLLCSNIFKSLRRMNCGDMY